MPDATNQTYTVEQMNGEDFSDYNFYGCNMPNGDVTGCDLAGAYWDENCTTTDAGRTRWYKCNVTDATTNNIEQMEKVWCYTEISGQTFDATDVEGSNWSGVHFIASVFPDAAVNPNNLSDATFDEDCTSSGTWAVMHDLNCTNVTAPDWMTIADTCNNKTVARTLNEF